MLLVTLGRQLSSPYSCPTHRLLFARLLPLTVFHAAGHYWRAPVCMTSKSSADLCLLPNMGAPGVQHTLQEQHCLSACASRET